MRAHEAFLARAREALARLPLRSQALVGAGGLTTAGFLQWMHAIPDVGHSRMMAVATAASGVIYAPRLYVHVRQGYLRHMWLLGLLTLDGALTIVWIYLGIQFFVDPPSAPAMLGLALALWFAVLIVAGVTVEAAERAGLKRGTDVVNACMSVVALRAVLKRLDYLFVFRYFDGLWDRKTPPGKISGFVVCVTAVLVILAGANAPATLSAGLKSAKTNGGSESSATAKKARTTTAPPTATMPTTSTAAVPPRPKPTVPPYARQCAGEVFPGYPATDHAAAKLYSLWLGVGGVGAIVAGCTQPATRMARHPEIWWAVGKCDGVTRSLGIAVPGQPAVLLLQQVARFTEPIARIGRVTGASTRTKISAGDFQIVHTDVGDYVLIRSEVAHGGIGGGETPTSCAQLNDVDVRYTVVPPGLIELWRTVARDTWAWPRPDNTHAGAGCPRSRNPPHI